MGADGLFRPECRAEWMWPSRPRCHAMIRRSPGQSGRTARRSALTRGEIHAQPHHPKPTRPGYRRSSPRRRRHRRRHGHRREPGHQQRGQGRLAAQPRHPRRVVEGRDLTARAVTTLQQGGTTGATGATGAKGEKGDTGAQGAKGEKGSNGANGLNPAVLVAKDGDAGWSFSGSPAAVISGGECAWPVASTRTPCRGPSAW